MASPERESSEKLHCCSRHSHRSPSTTESIQSRDDEPQSESSIVRTAIPRHSHRDSNCEEHPKVGCLHIRNAFIAELPPAEKCSLCRKADPDQDYSIAMVAAPQRRRSRREAYLSETAVESRCRHGRKIFEDRPLSGLRHSGPSPALVRVRRRNAFTDEVYSPHRRLSRRDTFFETSPTPPIRHRQRKSISKSSSSSEKSPHSPDGASPETPMPPSDALSCQASSTSDETTPDTDDSPVRSISPPRRQKRKTTQSPSVQLHISLEALPAEPLKKPDGIAETPLENASPKERSQPNTVKKPSLLSRLSRRDTFTPKSGKRLDNRDATKGEVPSPPKRSRRMQINRKETQSSPGTDIPTPKTPIFDGLSPPRCQDSDTPSLPRCQDSGTPSPPRCQDSDTPSPPRCQGSDTQSPPRCLDPDPSSTSRCLCSESSLNDIHHHHHHD